MPLSSTPAARRLTLPVANSTLLERGYPPAWPSKSPAEDLDYILDATAWLTQSAGDVLIQAEVFLSGPDTALTYDRASWTATAFTFWLHAGTAGGTYCTSCTLITQQSRRLQVDIGIPIIVAPRLAVDFSVVTVNAFPLTYAGRTIP